MEVPVLIDTVVMFLKIHIFFSRVKQFSTIAWTEFHRKCFGKLVSPPLKWNTTGLHTHHCFEPMKRVATNPRNNDTSVIVARGKIHYLSMSANHKCICTRCFILFSIPFFPQTINQRLLVRSEQGNWINYWDQKHTIDFNPTFIKRIL